MKLFSVFLAAAACAIAIDAQTPQPCTAPEYRQFDFWIGTWDVFSPDGKLAGHNRVERIESGRGLQENWTGDQFWLGNGGGVLTLSGTLEGRTLRLRGVTTSPRVPRFRIDSASPRTPTVASASSGKSREMMARHGR
jgi:hypothetical protein